MRLRRRGTRCATASGRGQSGVTSTRVAIGVSPSGQASRTRGPCTLALWVRLSVIVVVSRFVKACGTGREPAPAGRAAATGAGGQASGRASRKCRISPVEMFLWSIKVRHDLRILSESSRGRAGRGWIVLKSSLLASSLIADLGVEATVELVQLGAFRSPPQGVPDACGRRAAIRS